MKVFLCLLLTLCALLPAPLSQAVADGAFYACVTTKNCYFYDSPLLKSGLFILPESYFVKILDEQEESYHIQYLTDGQNTKALTGYVKKEELSPVDYVPDRPYLYKYFDVTYQTDGDVGDGFLTQITLSCTYYGDYYVGTNAYCYVLRGEEFGYVPKPAGFSYERNPEYTANLKPPASEENASATSPPYALFIALALLAPVVAFLLFRFSSKKPFEQPDER